MENNLTQEQMNRKLLDDRNDYKIKEKQLVTAKTVRAKGIQK